MSTFFYLVRPDNKTMFELGKNLWSWELKNFETEEKHIIEDPLFCGESYELYKITDKEILKGIVDVQFGHEELSNEYRKYILEGIWGFCQSEPFFIANDCDDSYYYLLKKEGYTKVGSIY